MPLYEYQCQACGARTEELQRFSDPPLTTCKICGGALTKLVSAPAFHLKGSGWYATDYGGKKKEGSSEDGPAAKSSEAGDGKGSSPSTGTASEASSSGSSGSSDSAAPKKESGSSGAKTGTDT